MKILKKLEMARIVIGTIIVLITLIWALVSYFDLHKPTTLVKSSYIVCIGDNPDRCPSDAIQQPCGSPIGSLINAECASYSLSNISKGAGGKCGVSIVEVTCL